MTRKSDLPWSAICQRCGEEFSPASMVGSDPKLAPWCLWCRRTAGKYISDGFIAKYGLRRYVERLVELLESEDS